MCLVNWSRVISKAHVVRCHQKWQWAEAEQGQNNGVFCSFSQGNFSSGYKMVVERFAMAGCGRARQSKGEGQLQPTDWVFYGIGMTGKGL